MNCNGSNIVSNMNHLAGFSLSQDLKPKKGNTFQKTN